MKKIIPFFVLFICVTNLKAQTQEELNQQVSRFFQLSLVTVDTGTWQNLVIWQKLDPQRVIDTVPQLTDFQINDYFVMRYDSASASYLEIGTVPYADLTVFPDLTSFPELRAYKYKIQASVSYTIDIGGGMFHSWDDMTVLDSCRYHKTLFIDKEIKGDTLELKIDPYQVENFDMTMFLDTLKVKVYRHTDSMNILDHLYDSVYYMMGDTLFQYSDPDTTPKDSGYNYHGIVEFTDTIDPNEMMDLKASGGPFSRSISNLEDNRLKETPTIIQSIKQEELTLKISPNPVASKTNIMYNIPAKGLVRISLYSADGKRIKDIVHKVQAKGDHTIEVSKEMLGTIPGINYLVLSFNEYQQVKKIIQLKE